jgi:hypothetical protein
VTIGPSFRLAGIFTTPVASSSASGSFFLNRHLFFGSGSFFLNRHLFFSSGSLFLDRHLFFGSGSLFLDRHLFFSGSLFLDRHLLFRRGLLCGGLPAEGPYLLRGEGLGGHVGGHVLRRFLRGALLGNRFHGLRGFLLSRVFLGVRLEKHGASQQGHGEHYCCYCRYSLHVFLHIPAFFLVSVRNIQKIAIFYNPFYSKL